MRKPNYRFVFGNGQQSSWYSFDNIKEDWSKLPPSIIKGKFISVIIEEEMTREEFRKRWPDIKV